MHQIVDRLDGLVFKEDLFKDVKYFVTGQLDPKVGCRESLNEYMHCIYENISWL